METDIHICPSRNAFSACEPEWRLVEKADIHPKP